MSGTQTCEGIVTLGLRTLKIHFWAPKLVSGAPQVYDSHVGVSS
jgi:hypothetical protein